MEKRGKANKQGRGPQLASSFRLVLLGSLAGELHHRGLTFCVAVSRLPLGWRGTSTSKQGPSFWPRAAAQMRGQLIYE